MAELTRNGVCYDLEASPYTFGWRDYRFHFSSEPHRRRFMERVRERELWLNDSMTRRFKYRADFSLLAVFQLYSQVETRGFYVRDLGSGATYGSVADVRFAVVYDG